MVRRSTLRNFLLPLIALLATATVSFAQAPARVFLRAGPKTHGPGEHDHPRFLEEWSVLLAERGAVVDGALRFPTAEELARTDVLVMYAAEGGSVAQEDRENLAKYLARGGGIVALHDAVCGSDPEWFKTIVGGAWEHGHSKWEIGEQGLYVTDEESPITDGVANFDLVDEIYYDLHLAPEAKVLATSFRTPFDVEPQLWTYEPGDYRAFVSIQGHYHATFSNPAWRSLLLRGIAWAAGRDVDELLREEEVRALRYPPGGPTSPEHAHDSFVLHPGFQAQLVAAEPLVVNPISLDWDAAGRMWVANTPGYPYKQESSGVPAHDSIVVLEDEDGDGRMDTRSVFAEGLDLVTSLVLHEDGVIVTQAPDILWLRDRDGDGAADERVVLYTGFGYADTHAVMSNLRWGVDGWVYATQGYSGGASRHVRNAEGHDFGSIGNGLFRFRADGSAIEVVSSYGSNTWGLDFDPSGELFFTMANGSHLRHVVLPEAALGGARVGGVNSWAHLPDHREVRSLVDHGRAVYQQIDFVGGFTAAAGSLLYDGGAWPVEFRGDHFVCEPTVSLVHRDQLTAEGVTYRASKPREPEFLASTDLWFRPVHLRTGPDGALYVLDFYNQAAIHNDTRGPEHGPTNAAVRPDRDGQHGRIWRVQHEDAVSTPFAGLSDGYAELVAELGDENSWRRETAQRLLREIDHPRGWGVLELHLAQAVEQGSTPAQRLLALWLMLAHDSESSATPRYVMSAFSDRDAGVRRNALRIAALLEPSADLDQSLWKVVATDVDPRARLLALVALAGRPLDVELTARLAARYEELEDDWSRTACLRALADQGAGALSSALAQNATELATELARRLGRGADPEQVDAFLVDCASARPDALAPTLRALEQALPGSFVPRTSEAALAALGSLLASDDLECLVATLALANRVDAVDALAPARTKLSAKLLIKIDDADVSYEAALACVEALISMPDSRTAAFDRVQEFLAASAPLDVQTRAIDVLASTSERQAGEVLAAALPSMSATARERALAALLARDPWVSALLDEVEARRVRPIDLGARAVHSLKHHPTAELAARAVELLEGGGDTDLDALVAKLLPQVTTQGDASRGAAHFAEHCGICHTFDGQGAQIGPELTGMGAHGAATLLPLILDPNREVDPAYLEYVVRRHDGRSETGLMVRETAESVVLRSTGGDSEIPRAEIAELRSSGLSLMPTGLESLGAEVLRDILAYLCDSYEGFRIVDLSECMNANSAAGMYDPERDPTAYRFQRSGVVEVAGVPFELLDPHTTVTGFNVLVLKGGPYGDWRCKRELTQRVELALEGDVGRVHVLGGVAGWGYPFGDGEGEPIVRWTFEYADGSREEHVLHNGTEFADWIGRYDVPGSELVEGLVANNSYGQLRTFTVTPRANKPLRGLLLESFDNHLAPTFMGLTLESAEHLARSPESSPEVGPADVLILGGGSSHDYERWFRDTDLATLRELDSSLDARYTSRAGDLRQALGADTVLVLCTNQALDGEARERITRHTLEGGGLLGLHPGTWRNWNDWEAHSRELLGGGASSHERLQEFDVELTDAGLSWLAAGASIDDLEAPSSSFGIRDELYRFEVEADATPITVLAEGVSRETGARYPVLWTTTAGEGRVVGCTLGHDGDAHEHRHYRRFLRRAVEWLGEER